MWWSRKISRRILQLERPTSACPGGGIDVTLGSNELNTMSIVLLHYVPDFLNNFLFSFGHQFKRGEVAKEGNWLPGQHFDYKYLMVNINLILQYTHIQCHGLCHNLSAQTACTPNFMKCLLINIIIASHTINGILMKSKRWSVMQCLVRVAE